MLESFGVVWALVTANYEIVLGIVVAVVALLVVSAFVLIGSRSRLPARLARLEHDLRATREELAAIREALVALREEMRADRIETLRGRFRGLDPRDRRRVRSGSDGPDARATGQPGSPGSWPGSALPGSERLRYSRSPASPARRGF